MKVTALNPQWIDVGPHEKVGMLIDCPVHAGGDCVYPRIPIYFANPPSGAPMLPKHEGDDGRWTLTGLGFADMTLSPSILYPKPKYGPQHWHGWIRNGEIA